MRNRKPKTLLRPLSMSDLDNVMTWVNDKEVTKNLAKFNKKITRNEEKKFLKNLLKSKTDCVFSIEDENHNYVGQVGIHQIYWPAKNGRLGIIIGNKNAWGKGHASKALKLVIDYAFKKLKLNKIWMICYITNKKMQHICKKLGFKKEGVLREEYYHQKEYHDMLRMSILRKEWPL